MISLYGVFQSAISSYTNIVWAFPAAFFALNAVVLDKLKDLANEKDLIFVRLGFAIFNLLFLQAFFKLVSNQKSIVDALKDLEKTLKSDLIIDDKSIIPNF